MGLEKLFIYYYLKPMPELPEVEVLRRDLLKKMPVPARIVRIRLVSPSLRTPLRLPASIRAKPVNVLNIRRRSKYLIFDTDQGILLSHLGMSGYWRTENVLSKRKHDHVVIEWENGLVWVYNDPRRFGVFEYYKTEKQVKRFSDLGPEPFSAEFLDSETIKKIKSSERAIKAIIMDAKVMVGVGNIYASEALFQAKINPFKNGSKLSIVKVTTLLTVIRETLQKAIDNGGSSIRDYVHLNGEKGNYQDQHLVYGRDGQECVQCRSKIRIKKIQGRSTFWCVSCQP